MKKKTRWPIYLIIGLIITFIAFTVPLPYYIEVPGTSEDIRKVLQVNNQSDQEEGSYQFVTVGVKHARLVDLVYAWLRDDWWFVRCGIYANQPVLHGNFAKHGQISRSEICW